MTTHYAGLGALIIFAGLLLSWLSPEAPATPSLPVAATVLLCQDDICKEATVSVLSLTFPDGGSVPVSQTEPFTLDSLRAVK